ncbi:hypothetical protein V6N11_055381 [Hibiscus sabdariffa]|uniref:Uncharacterized protein n=1 Tax=Hibiscus sabdariffa TaxID=183260 RepID=A0ABR2PF32_9ROSI
MIPVSIATDSLTLDMLRVKLLAPLSSVSTESDCSFTFTGRSPKAPSVGIKRVIPTPPSSASNSLTTLEAANIAVTTLKLWPPISDGEGYVKISDGGG